MFPDTLLRVLRDADCLLIVPPFASLDRPSLGAHVLQACARERGFDVVILYANLILAGEIGELNHQVLTSSLASNLPGEQFFAEAAYGCAGGVVDALRGCAATKKRLMDRSDPVDWDRLEAFAGRVGVWVEDLAQGIARFSFRAVGCTTMFEQTAASLALLRTLKRIRPDVLAIIGGSNCEGPMAEGMRALCPELDYVFSGECEEVFPAFLASVAQGELPDTPIIQGTPCMNLDAVPTPDYSNYYDQLAAFLPESEYAASGAIWLSYETSRGCWWGQKHHCTFCGLNGEGMGFREKSPDRVLTELRVLLEKHPTREISMADNIMPHRYFKTLLPRLEQELPGLHIYYEQKANLSLERVLQLKAAGVLGIQPGIEALSTPLLAHMKKGITAAQNITLLRYTRAAGLSVFWNLLYDFPGDRAAWYEATIALIPLLTHLYPPSGAYGLNIDRFSPYFDHPDDYGLQNVRPRPAYSDIVPEHVDVAQVAYHFVADYESVARSDPALIKTLKRRVAAWKAKWESGEQTGPVLAVTPLMDDQYLLTDTRGAAAAPQFELIDKDRAALALVGRTDKAHPDLEAWAIERKVCVELDGKLVPLATAAVEVLQHFENVHRQQQTRRSAALSLS